jgi:hypothetical protein
MSRRILLTRSSLGLAAAGVAGLMPVVPAAIAVAESDAPDAEATIGEGESLAAPLVAQVKNLETGEVSIFSGLREISVFDRGLAARLFNAAK